MKKALHIFLFLYTTHLHAQQIDLCLSGSGFDELFHEVKFLPDSSKLFFIFTGSRDGVFQSDSAMLYLVKTDQFNQVQFVHPIYSPVTDTFSNSLYPTFPVMGSLFINSGEIFVPYITESRNANTDEIYRMLNYQMIDYNGNIIDSASNVFSVQQYALFSNTQYSINEMKIISSGAGNYSIAIKRTASFQGYVTEDFPLVKIQNYAFTPVNIFNFPNNEGGIAYRNIVTLDSFFVYSLYFSQPNAFSPFSVPEVTVINGNGNIVFDSILNNSTGNSTKYISSEHNQLYFTIYSQFMHVDSTNNEILDSATSKTYLLDASSALQLHELAYKDLPVNNNRAEDTSYMDVILPQRNIKQYNYFASVVNESELNDHYFLSMRSLSDSDFNFQLINIDNNALPPVYSFTAHSYNISHNLVYLADGSTLFMYKIKEENNFHMVKISSSQQVLVEKIIPVTVYTGANEDVYLDYLPVSQKFIAQIRSYDSLNCNLYIIDSTGDPGRNALKIFSRHSPETFVVFENSQKNIFSIVQYNTSDNIPSCFQSSSDVIIYKLNSGLNNFAFIKAFIDYNGNNVKDSVEPIYYKGLVRYNIHQRINSSSLLPDDFTRIFIDKEKTFFTVSLTNPYLAVNPDTVFIDPQTENTSDTIYFAVLPKQPVNDLAVSVVPVTPAIPGTQGRFNIICSNKGNQEIPSATISIILDPRITVQSVNSAYTLTHDTLTINLSDLILDEDRTFEVLYLADIPPSLQRGDTIQIKALASSIVTEADMVNNRDTASIPVRSSYDPNDKTVNHTFVDPDSIPGAALIYTIRFENTGNYNAARVIIRDTLPANGDLSTLRILGASHAYQATVEDGKYLTIFFDNINLPYTAADSIASKGFVSYEIKLNNSFTEVHNTAYISFDYNVAIKTNTATTQFNLATVVKKNIAPQIKCYPNPASDLITIDLMSFVQQPITVRMFDQSGRMAFSGNFKNVNLLNLDVHSIPAGIYKLVVFTGNEVAGYTSVAIAR